MVATSTSFSWGSVHQSPPRKVIHFSLADSSIDQNFPENSWPYLSKVIEQIFNSDLNFSAEVAYRLIDEICMRRQDAWLLGKVRSFSETFIIDLLKRFDYQDKDDYAYLIRVRDEWSKFAWRAKLLQSVFLSLDRCMNVMVENEPIKKRRFLDSNVQNLIKNIFRKFFIEDENVNKVFLTALLKQFDGWRDKRISAESLKGVACWVMEMFNSLDLYIDFFEESFFQRSKEFFAREASDFNGKFEDFLVLAKSRLEDNTCSFDFGLSKSSISLVKKILLETVVKLHLPKMLKSGEVLRLVMEIGGNSFDEGCLQESLKKAVYLSKEINLLEPVLSQWEEGMTRLGMEICNCPEAERNSIVARVVDLHGIFKRQANNCFLSSEKSLNALKNAFDKFLNNDGNLLAQLLAESFASLLNSWKVQNNPSTNIEISQFLVIFRMLRSKDVFEAFYRKDFARRIIFLHCDVKGYILPEIELEIVRKFKLECGPAYTNKLETLIRDLEISESLTREFLKSENSISFFLLTSGIWPTYSPTLSVSSSTIFSLPPLPAPLPIYPVEVSSKIDSFSEFYKKKFNGRSIKFFYPFGTCIVRGKFPSRHKKSLVVSHLQATILILFNEREEISQEFLRKKLGEGDGLTEAVDALCGSAPPILEKKPGNLLCVNGNFKSNSEENLYALPKSFLGFLGTSEEIRQTHARVVEDRQFQIEAAIMRILKFSKSISINKVILDTISILPFPGQPDDIKGRIDSLIDREYIERDKVDTFTLHYIT